MWEESKRKQSLQGKHLFLSIQRVSFFCNLLWLEQDYKKYCVFVLASSLKLSWIIWDMITQWEGYLDRTKQTKSTKKPTLPRKCDWELFYWRLKNITSAAPTFKVQLEVEKVCIPWTVPLSVVRFLLTKAVRLSFKFLMERSQITIL